MPNRCQVCGNARSLFNNLAPIVQDKRAEEEGGEGGNGPSQIGRVKEQHKDDTGATQWGIKG